MSKKCKTTFILKEFFENKSIEWNLHVDSNNNNSLIRLPFLGTVLYMLILLPVHIIMT